MYSHVTDNELFPVLQSACRKGHSTETVLLRVINGILTDMNKQPVSILVLLDLIVAFDTVMPYCYADSRPHLASWTLLLHHSHRIYLDIASMCR